MIGIAGATGAEMKTLLSEIQAEDVYSIGGFEFIKGKLFGKEVIASRCGIGKVSTATCCQTMILNFAPELIFNIGAAGALKEGLSVGDIVLVNSVVQYDVDTTAHGDPLGMVSGINKIFFDCCINDDFKQKLTDHCIHWVEGKDATADAFCSDKKVKDMLISHFGCTSVEMELGAMAHICYLNNTPCEAVKIISDTADENSKDDYTKYTQIVGDRVMEILKIRLSVF